MFEQLLVKTMSNYGKNIQKDQGYSNARVSTLVNSSQHESTRANSNQYESDTVQQVTMNQRKSSKSQHKSARLRHESTRVRRESTRVQHESTRTNTNLKQV